MPYKQILEEVCVYQDKLVTRKERSILFGLIKWEEIVRTDIIGNDIYIFSQNQPINKVFLDGVELFRQQ